MKKIILIAGLGLTMNALAQNLPKVERPVELTSGEFSEGTITQLSAKDIQEFLPWAQNAKKVLEEALQESKRLPLTERVGYLEQEIKNVVKASGNKQYQMLMRFALNRGLLLSSILEKEADKGHKGIIENQLDILSRTIEMALANYESDLSFQEQVVQGKSEDIHYYKFGWDLGMSLIKASQNILDASAQYKILYKSLEMMNWDISQDKDAKDYAEIILDIYRTLGRLPFNHQTDLEYFAHTRDLNYLVGKLEVWRRSNSNATPDIDRENAVLGIYRISEGYDAGYSVKIEIRRENGRLCLQAYNWNTNPAQNKCIPIAIVNNKFKIFSELDKGNLYFTVVDNNTITYSFLQEVGNFSYFDRINK